MTGEKAVVACTLFLNKRYILVEGSGVKKKPRLVKMVFISEMQLLSYYQMVKTEIS